MRHPCFTGFVFAPVVASSRPCQFIEHASTIFGSLHPYHASLHILFYLHAVFYGLTLTAGQRAADDGDADLAARARARAVPARGRVRHRHGDARGGPRDGRAKVRAAALNAHCVHR